MQTIDLEMTKELSDALFNPRASSLFREPSREDLVDYARVPVRLGASKGLGSAQGAVYVRRSNQKTAIATGDPASIWPNRNLRRVHPDAEAPAAPTSSGNLLIPESYISHAKSLPDQIERISHALTATELAEWLAVSRITVFKLAKAGRIPSFRIGTCVRFDPREVAKWLRQR
jgi:excisionase family DNA binding protein